MSGIYIIKCKNGYFYIGQAIDFSKRWKRHLNELRKGIHANKRLQNIYNKYGENNFAFEKLIECDIENLDNEEQKFLDLYLNKEKCLNISMFVANPMKGRKHKKESIEKIKQKLLNRDKEIYKKVSEKLTGRKRTEEDKIKMRKAKTEDTKRKMSEYSKNRSEQHRKKISENMLGEKNPNYGKRLGRATEFQPKYFRIMSPDGIIYEGVNLTQFAKKHGLTQASIINVNNGKAKSHKGWTKPN